MQVHTVPDGINDVRLDKYLLRLYPAVSQIAFKRAMSQRDFKINGVRANGFEFINTGDELKIYISDQYLFGTINIVYQDDEMLVINKPAGLSVEEKASGDSLTHRVQLELGEIDGFLPMPCHRLDHNTSGLIIYAKTRDAHVKILEAFKQHHIKKYYECLVVGMPTEDTKTLTAYLKKDSSNSYVKIYDHFVNGALPTTLKYEVLERGDISRLRVTLITGRTHQIRAQLAHVGLSILGDEKYGDFTANRTHGRRIQALCCTELQVFGKTITCKAPF